MENQTLLADPDRGPGGDELAAEAGVKDVKQDAAAALDRLKAREQIKPLTITPAKPDGEKP